MRLLLTIFLLGLTVLKAIAQTKTAMSSPATPVVAALSSPMRTYALRLAPGQDLRQQLQVFAQANQIKAATIVTGVGSLTTVKLRLANQPGPTEYKGHFEVVSLVGTLSINGSHLHLAVADSTGRTIGGHLVDGNLVYTTMELVVGVLEELDFRRETDPVSTYQELVVYPADHKAKKARQNKSPKP
ncbi:DNA-binding protein [Hymenobacter sp. BT188]|uniref:PPC domain-containing DNA-binding protein n=1 Tax=Hymenobacter sp. BT188 TaxID=2763504 RepID=UPI00165107B3|nr:PPC domain-containing DNA-binding protein [Hymenobacter sp. BT188]MBC6606363.1 DNA-binding protein [Hymenobacter sp. BT188]